MHRVRRQLRPALSLTIIPATAAAPLDDPVRAHDRPASPTMRPLARRPRHSRVKSSTTASTLIPALGLTACRKSKSSDQRWFAASGSAMGERVPNARFRPPRLRTPSCSSGRAGTAACGSAGHHHAPAEYAAADSQTVVAHRPARATGHGYRHRRIAWRHTGRSSALGRPTHTLAAASSFYMPGSIAQVAAASLASVGRQKLILTQHLLQRRHVQHLLRE